MPDSWQIWRPSWVMLVLSFWVLYIPERVGLFWALIVGLMLDVILNTSMGLHGFALAITTFILQLLYKRIRLFPLWKQGLSLAIVSAVYLAITYWLGRLTGKSIDTLPWIGIVLNGILWPWIYLLLKQIAGYFKVK